MGLRSRSILTPLTRVLTTSLFAVTLVPAIGSPYTLETLFPPYPEDDLEFLAVPYVSPGELMLGHAHRFFSELPLTHYREVIYSASPIQEQKSS